MKTLNTKNIVDLLISRGIFLLMIFCLALNISCNDNDPDPKSDQDSATDVTAPIITIDGIDNTSLLSLNDSNSDNSFVVVFKDDVGLTSYSIDIENSDIAISKDTTATEVAEIVDVSSLTLDQEYGVMIKVEDQEGNADSLNFRLIINSEAIDEPTASYTELYVLGSGTSGGWDMSSPSALTRNAGDTLVWEWQGDLSVGELKFSTYKDDVSADPYITGDWLLPASLNPTIVDGQANDLVIWDAVTEGAPTGSEDTKWQVDVAGNYTITIDFNDSTVTFDLVTAKVGFEALYLVGSATPGGWDLGNKTAMTADVSNSALFTWQGALISGSMKIAAENADFGSGQWIHPTTDGQALNETSYEVIIAGTGGTDYQWQFDAGNEAVYKVTVDTENATITFEYIEALPTYYTELNLVGDATPGGWDLNSQTAMTVDGSNPAIFTATVALGAGSLKIHATSVADWCAGEWLNASTADQSISGSPAYIVTTGCDGPDNKWVVTAGEAGTYLITIDLENGTIAFALQ
ncbi:SusF/SusE family outer membrane protein [Marinoscillum sp. MHG1-6]|uniref:SusF/SusE family outer membrane protein n=1 Tax=Marinoscillum sp. MHG1-6 TaxID=2959627 RepID=UPI0021588A98|nr:SusF/SusE family outer membrane protein [Marinoscillum sp. MHG1-6]